MAQVVSGSQIKLNNGQTINAQQGGWYDAQQFWGGTLSAPGVINSLSDQIGAGKPVSAEVNRQTSVAAGKAPNANQDYINALNAKGVTGSGQANPGNLSGYTDNGSSATSGAGVGYSAPAASLNLPDLYKGLAESTGISAIEKDITDKTKSYNDAVSKINDNPFLSEASRTGRQQKLTTDFNNSIKTQQDSLVMKKQDIQTQIDLQTKQFDINSSVAKQALDQFNLLLTSGALAGASGNDIAQITKSTGISSGMVQAAISANAKKNVQTQVITSTNDAGVVTATVVNTQTGEIISKTSLGAIGNAQQGAKATEADKTTYYQNALRQDTSGGKLTVPQIFSIYSGYLDPNSILNIYNSTSPYGQATESRKVLEGYGVKFGTNQDPYNLNK